MNNDQLNSVLNDLHASVAEHLRSRLQSDECDPSDIRAVLTLLKQNNILVTITPELANHTDQLEAARESAEAAGSPFGHKQSKA